MSHRPRDSAARRIVQLSFYLIGSSDLEPRTSNGSSDLELESAVGHGKCYKCNKKYELGHLGPKVHVTSNLATPQRDG